MTFSSACPGAAKPKTSAPSTATHARTGVTLRMVLSLPLPPGASFVRAFDAAQAVSVNPAGYVVDPVLDPPTRPTWRPRPPQPTEVRTGGCGGRSPPHSEGVVFSRASWNRGGGTRTPGLRFWRPPLYQLSYAPRVGRIVSAVQSRSARAAAASSARRRAFSAAVRAFAGGRLRPVRLSLCRAGRRLERLAFVAQLAAPSLALLLRAPTVGELVARLRRRDSGKRLETGRLELLRQAPRAKRLATRVGLCPAASVAATRSRTGVVALRPEPSRIVRALRTSSAIAFRSAA